MPGVLRHLVQQGADHLVVADTCHRTHADVVAELARDLPITRCTIESLAASGSPPSVHSDANPPGEPGPVRPIVLTGWLERWQVDG